MSRTLTLYTDGHCQINCRLMWPTTDCEPHTVVNTCPLTKFEARLFGSHYTAVEDWLQAAVTTALSEILLIVLFLVHVFTYRTRSVLLKASVEISVSVKARIRLWHGG